MGRSPTRRRITVKIHGHQREASVPISATKQDIDAWKDRERVKLRDENHEPAARGTFAKDVERYLLTLVNRPQLQKERTRYLKWWTDQFGRRPRAELRRDELAGALAELSLKKSASHVNHVHSALFNLITVLDGKAKPNIMRDVPRAVEPEAEPRGIPYALVRAIMAKLPDRGQGIKNRKRATVSKTKIRLRLMAYSGMTYAQMKRLELSDLRPGGVFVKRRRKGKGVAGSIKPLNADARQALADFVAADCWGNFSRHSVYKSFQRACRAVERDAKKAGTKISLTGIRPYDLRHAFGSAAFRATGNLQTVGELLDHKSLKTTRRYALEAIPDHLIAASSAVEAFIAAGNASQDSEK